MESGKLIIHKFYIIEEEDAREAFKSRGEGDHRLDDEAREGVDRGWEEHRV